MFVVSRLLFGQVGSIRDIRLFRLNGRGLRSLTTLRENAVWPASRSKQRKADDKKHRKDTLENNRLHVCLLCSLFDIYFR